MMLGKAPHIIDDKSSLGDSTVGMIKIN